MINEKELIAVQQKTISDLQAKYDRSIASCRRAQAAYFDAIYPKPIKNEEMKAMVVHLKLDLDLAIKKRDEATEKLANVQALLRGLKIGGVK